jgi:ATP-binding protein involved in chromosome partitioning
MLQTRPREVGSGHHDAGRYPVEAIFDLEQGISTMSADLQAALLSALRTIPDPTRAESDIVSEGRIEGLSIKDGLVAFALKVDPELGSQLEPLRQAAEAVAAAVPGVRRASVVLTADRAPQQARAAAHTHTPKANVGKLELAGIRSVIAVASGKGGVGKSTTAVNLALGLLGMGLRVGLVDADIYGPSLPRLTGLRDFQPQLGPDKRVLPAWAYGLKCMSIGFFVAEDNPTIWRGPMVQSALQQLIRDTNWGDLDVLVVDMPPGTGDAQLTLAQQVPLAGAVIVSTPQDIALLDARKGLNMFRKVDVPVLGIVENMSYFCCPNCGHRAEIFGHGGARAEAAALNVPFLGEVPLHLDIRETSDNGTPIVASQPGSTHALAYMAIAEAVWAQVATGLGVPRRQPPRMVVMP